MGAQNDRELAVAVARMMLVWTHDDEPDASASYAERTAARYNAVHRPDSAGDAFWGVVLDEIERLERASMCALQDALAKGPPYGNDPIGVALSGQE